MATGTRNKRITQKEMRDRLLGKLDQQASHLAGLVNNVEKIAMATSDAAQEIEELKALGMTLSEVEEATGISSYRLSAFTRQARGRNEENEDGEALEVAVSDSADSESKVDQEDTISDSSKTDQSLSTTDDARAGLVSP
ncbi:hypothetical protein [Corynebacterium sp. A21]|uniref:hypothetical protein n=1 Tax=Corynebacterium sp. A21 TaxID=3457318 RepID=UPI003FD4C5CC